MDGERLVNLFQTFRRGVSHLHLGTSSQFYFGMLGGLLVSALVSGPSGPGSSSGRGHCVVFLGKTLYSHGASLQPGV